MELSAAPRPRIACNACHCVGSSARLKLQLLAPPIAESPEAIDARHTIALPSHR